VTEQDWLACTTPRPMLEVLRGRGSDRKLRLFAVACCRRIWPHLTDEKCRKAVEVAERYADGQAISEELSDPWPLHFPAPMPSVPAEWANAKAEASAGDAARLAAARDTKKMGLVYFTWEVARYAAGAGAWKIAGAAKNATHAASWASAWNQTEADEYDEQVLLLRDILGNPFRPAALRPSWLKPDTISLGGHIYDERAFDRLPLLAVALEDAGCHNADVLTHCRQPGPHVRGCWVVDLVLGKK
jgi:hypothetical protein